MVDHLVDAVGDDAPHHDVKARLIELDGVRVGADFEELFPRDIRVRDWTSRSNSLGHNKRLVDICVGGQSDLVNRSIFGAVKVFNQLPGFVLDVDAVPAT